MLEMLFPSRDDRRSEETAVIHAERREKRRGKKRERKGSEDQNQEETKKDEGIKGKDSLHLHPDSGDRKERMNLLITY